MSVLDIDLVLVSRTLRLIFTEAMTNRFSGFATPGRMRKPLPATTNTRMVFPENTDFDEADVNDFDENYPVVRDAFLHNHPARQSMSQYPNQSKNIGPYYTPQVKRKRIENPATSASEDPLKEELNLVKLMLTEAHQKIDFMHKKQEMLEKKFDHVQKDIGGISRHVVKGMTVYDIPKELPVVEYNGVNILNGKVFETPNCLMKALINDLFTKVEIMQGKHEDANERTEKIKEAVCAYFFQDKFVEFKAFWDNQGHVTRGNQRRGRSYRNRNQTTDTEATDQGTVDSLSVRNPMHSRENNEWEQEGAGNV